MRPEDLPVEHHTIDAEGVRIHAVSAGEGPTVLLVHGFPELWWSWRHQLVPVAEAGWRAVAIDVRGYGRSGAPSDIEAYSMLRLVGDCVRVAEHFGGPAVIVGHDWGAPIAWNSALVRGDLFRAVAGLSVPYAARGERAPLEAFAAMGGDEEFYISYFQQPGRAEAEIEPDVRGWLLGFYWSASADGAGANIATVPRGGRMRDRFAYPTDGMPSWLPAEDFEVYVADFERTGLTGGLNRYRNVQRDWLEMAPWRFRPVQVPALFIGGDRDGPTLWGRPAIDRFGVTLPRLWRSVILEGCGHWTQQERPGEVNELLIGFLDAVRDEVTA